jgi:hypothetical protein
LPDTLILSASLTPGPPANLTRLGLDRTVRHLTAMRRSSSRRRKERRVEPERFLSEPSGRTGQV